MKEEIGIEKLIELLNEWELEVGSSRLKWFIGNNPIGIYCKSSEYHFGFFSKIILISKEYGFISWLVENDKINLLQLDNRIALSMSIEFNKVERVLMALSISDTPIDLLCSLLK